MLAEEEFHRLPKRQVMITMGGVMLALFLASLDQTVVGTAMPRMIADLGGFDRYTWVTTAYLVAATTAVPIVGRLTDMYGRKSFYIGGIVVFLAGSVLAGVSQTIDQLIAFRALQGIGGGVMMATSFVVVGDLFPPAERGKYQGYVAAAFGLSSVIGPTLGGFITDTLSWRWIFYINIPTGIPIVLLFIRFFPASRPAVRKHRLDFLGMALLLVAVLSLLLGLSWADAQFEWVSPHVIGALLLAVVATAVFILVERRAHDPIMPLDIYRNKTVSLSMVAMTAVGFGMFGGIIFIPLYFQGVLGASATSSGSFLTPMMLGVVMGATLAGQALSRLSGRYRLQGLIGIAIMSTGMFLVSRMTTETSYGQAVASIVVMGLGLGTTFPTFMIAVQNSVPHAFLGVATSATQFYRSIGGAVGLAVLGSLMASRFASGLFESLPPAAQEAVSRESLAALSRNPQALMDPDTLKGLVGDLGQTGPEGAAVVDQLLLGLRMALSSAISDVFVVALLVLAIGFVVTAFLKEFPLRGRESASSTGPAGGEIEEASA